MSAAAYAQRLLRSLNSDLAVPGLREEHPAFLWAQSGMMALTGPADSQGLMCPAPLGAVARGALAALQALAPHATLDFNAERLLGERAALAGHTRQGERSPGGSCRLWSTLDGHLALNLAREEDRELLPAWLGVENAPSDDVLGKWIAQRTLHDLIEQGRLLGLAVAPVVPVPSKAVSWFEMTHRASSRMRSHRPRVVDFSSLWAGPLCTHLLQACGAEVIKVESLLRPDGARQGPAAFFDLLNAGKTNVSLDFSSTQGRAQLGALIASADIVIEASRPRALRQLGIHAETLLHENTGLTWISLTGYGRGEPQENWIAYGDDAGVAGGLTWLMRQAGAGTVMVGDAIADPLTGLHAAVAAYASHQQGGGQLISIPLVNVVRHAIQWDLPTTVKALKERQEDWTARVASVPVAMPRARRKGESGGPSESNKIFN